MTSSEMKQAVVIVRIVGETSAFVLNRDEVQFYSSKYFGKRDVTAEIHMLPETMPSNVYLLPL